MSDDTVDAYLAQEKMEQCMRQIIDEWRAGQHMPATRDTRFAGFAALLLQEIDEAFRAVTEWSIENNIDSEEIIGQELTNRWLSIVARRAYDFACHIANQVHEADGSAMDCELRTPQDVVDEMDDMRQWPEER